MADISYECPACGVSRMASEFAEPKKIQCATCGIGMRKSGEQRPETLSPDPDIGTPQTFDPPTKSGKANLLKLARPKPAPAPEGESKGAKPALQPAGPTPPLELHPKTKRKKPLISQTFLAFLLFLLVGGSSGYLRYGNVIDPELLADVMRHAWAGVLLLHIIVTIKALSSDMMQGILCLFIPGWSFLHLILSDQFYLKSIIFGLLVGIGEDGGLQLLGYASQGFTTVQEFINSGGGDLRRAP